MAKITSILANTVNYFSRKPHNALLKSRSEQYSGEWSKDLPFARYYEYYHQTPAVKRNINSIHRRWMGSSIEVTSQDKTWDKLWQIWSDTTNFIPTLKEFTLDTLITGTGLLEKQFYNGMFANIEHIPTKTLWKIYPDEFAKVLSIWQLRNGDSKQLAPENMIIFPINNPERDAIGKSAMYAVAVPQKIAGKTDSLGNTINPERYLPSILDVKMRLNYAHMEIAEKQAKAMWFVSLKGMKDKKRQQEIEKSLENEESSKYITVTDGEVSAVPLEFKNAVANERYLEDVDKQINQASGFPGDVIDKGSDMGYASSQTPMQDLSMSIEDMQNDLSEMVQDKIFKPLCEMWKLDYDKVQPKLIFNTFVEKITFEQLIKIPRDHPIADEEIRGAYKEFLPGMDDKKWEEFKKERDAKNMQEIKAKTGSVGKVDPDRPDVEKDRPKPDANSMEYLLKNPKAFEEYVSELVATKATEAQTVSYWISELKKNHPEWKQDQIIAVAMQKSKEYSGYFAMPPVDGQPYTANPPEVTDPEKLERIMEILNDIKTAKVADTKVEEKFRELNIITQQAVEQFMQKKSEQIKNEVAVERELFKKQITSATEALDAKMRQKAIERDTLTADERKELSNLRRELTNMKKATELENVTMEKLKKQTEAYDKFMKKLDNWNLDA